MRLLSVVLMCGLAVAQGRTLNEVTAPSPAAPPTPINTAYTFTAATAMLDRSAQTLTLTGLSPVVTGTVSADGDAMPLRLAVAEVLGPARFAPLFAGPGPVQALLDGDVPGSAGPSTPPAPARVALRLTPGSAAYDGKAGTLVVGLAAEGPAAEAGVQAGGLVEGALAHTGPDAKAAAAAAVRLDAAALTLDVGVPQAAAALARARAKAAAAAAPTPTGKVAAASVP